MYKRRFIVSVLSLCLLFNFNLYAEENSSRDSSDNTAVSKTEDSQSGILIELSTQQKAEILNKLNIISGDGKGNYALDSKLNRSEAAAFIVKILGKDTYIKENKKNYMVTSFKDVKSTDWFLPYISYCEKNSIISGMGNGKFGPSQYISEKAFLVLVMKALGYSSEVGDFEWESVYSNAYRLGLVKDANYEYKVEENNDFTRGEVVNILYNSLILKLKNKSITLLQSLTNEGIVKRDVAYSTGLLSDTTIAAITSTVPQNKNRLAITFNEEIIPTTLENIKIYESNRILKSLTVKSIISQSENKLVLETDDQTIDKDYSIEISNVTDMEGNTDKLVSATFKGYKLTELTSDIFRISKVHNVSQNEIYVYFTHPINENCEVPSYYQIYENDQLFVEGKSSTMKIKALTSEKSAIAITLFNKELNPQNEYKIKIASNLVSVYGTTLNNGLGDESTFIPSTITPEAFSLKTVSGSSYNTIQLTFNQAVNSVLAKQIYNYYITDSTNNTIQIKQVTIADVDGKVVNLAINGVLDKTKRYTLMINRLTDIDKEEEIVEKTYEFSGDYPAQVELQLLGIVVNDYQMISLEFNKGIDEDSAKNAAYYTITETSNSYKTFTPDNIFYSRDNPNQVRLYFKSANALKNLTGYQLKISPLFKDNTGIAINKTIDFGFAPINPQLVNLSIGRAVTISNDTIMVKFVGKEISIDYPNSNAQNYSIEYIAAGETYKKIPIAVTYVDINTVILKFDNLSTDQAYTLKCSQIKTYAGDIIKSNDIQYVVTKGQ